MSDASSVHRAALSIDGAREAGKLAPWLWTGGTLLALLVLNAGVGPVAIPPGVMLKLVVAKLPVLDLAAD